MTAVDLFIEVVIVIVIEIEKGRVAEWLGRGLQNLVQRFESARDLKVNHKPPQSGGFFVLK